MKLILILIGMTLASTAAFGTTVIEFDAVTGRISVDCEPKSGSEVEVQDINDLVVKVVNTNTFLYTVTPSSTYSSIDRWKDFREAVMRIAGSTSFVNTAIVQLSGTSAQEGGIGMLTTFRIQDATANESMQESTMREIADLRISWANLAYGNKSIQKIASTIADGMLEIHRALSYEEEWQATRRLRERLDFLQAIEFRTSLDSFIAEADEFIWEHPEVEENTLKEVKEIRAEALALLEPLGKIEPIINDLTVLRNEMEIHPPGHHISDNVREITISHEAIDADNARRLVLVPQKSSIRLRKKSSGGVEPHIGVSLVGIPLGIASHTFKPAPQENGEILADTVSTTMRYYDYAVNLGVRLWKFGGGFELLLNPVDDIRLLGLGGFVMAGDHIKVSIGGCATIVQEVNRESLLQASPDVENVPTRDVLKPSLYIGLSFVGWGGGEE